MDSNILKLLIPLGISIFFTVIFVIIMNHSLKKSITSSGDCKTCPAGPPGSPSTVAGPRGPAGPAGPAGPSGSEPGQDWASKFIDGLNAKGLERDNLGIRCMQTIKNPDGTITFKTPYSVTDCKANAPLIGLYRDGVSGKTLYKGETPYYSNFVNLLTENSDPPDTIRTGVTYNCENNLGSNCMEEVCIADKGVCIGSYFPTISNQNSYKNIPTMNSFTNTDVKDLKTDDHFWLMGYFNGDTMNYGSD